MLAYDTYLKVEHLELQRLRGENRVGTAAAEGTVAMSQLFNRTDLGLPPLSKADGPEGIEEAAFLYKNIEPATRTDDEAQDAKEGAVQFINDYRKVRKGHKKGGGGASEDDTSSMSEMSTNLFSASAPQQPMPDAPAMLLSSTAATTSLNGMEAHREDQGGNPHEDLDDDMLLIDVLAEVKSSPSPGAAAGKKRKKVVIEEEEEGEEEHDDDDDLNLQQLLLAHVKAASPSIVPAPSAAPTGAAAARKKQKTAEKQGGGGGKGGVDDGFIIPRKQPRLADGALNEGRGAGGQGGEGGGGGGTRGEVNLREARPTTSAATLNAGARAFPPPSLPSSSAPLRPVPGPVLAPALPGAGFAQPTAATSFPTSACAPNELKRRLKVLKRAQAALAPVDLPFFLQAWGQIMGKDRQRVLEALTRSSDAVRAAFRCAGGLGGLVYWLHDQMSPRGLGAQENKVLQGEPGSAQIFIQMLRLAQGLVDAIADTAWNVEVGEWRVSQAGPVLAEVEERLVPHILDCVGGEEGKGEGGDGGWPDEAKRVATGVVRTVRAALAFSGRYPTPQERARLASHPPQTPSVLLQPARVGGEVAGNQRPAGASQAGNAVAEAATTAVGAVARNRAGLRVSFKAGEGLRQVHNYTRLEMTADEEARHRSTSLMDVKTADEELDKALNCWVS